MKPVVLILGTVHFSGWEKWIDGQQAHLEHLVECLAAFSPTRLALEVFPKDEAVIQRAYEAFVRGEAELELWEGQQIGFRLARRCGLDRVAGFDADWQLSWEGLRELFPSEEALEKALAECGAVASEAHAEVRRLIGLGAPVAQVLRVLNSPAYQSANHSYYLRVAELGNGVRSGGAEYTASWYLRNLRMYANLCRIAGEQERVVAIVGSDHAKIVLEACRGGGRLEVADALAFLP